MSRGYKAGVRGGGGIIPPGPVVPDGKTVTPINDIPIWLKCAGIPTTTYTTLAEVLADASLLRVLINSENAMDYLVRCKGFIGDDVKIPVMTSNTAPSGQCFGYPGELDSRYMFYKAFDNDNSTYWLPNTNSLEQNFYKIGYMFTSLTVCNHIKIEVSLDSGVTTEIKIEGSTDGTNWTELDTIEIISSITDTDFNNNSPYVYYRVTFKEVTHYSQDRSTGNVSVNTLELSYIGLSLSQTAMQFIGANDYASNLLLGDEDWLEGICNSEYFEDVLTTKVPTMTSDTTPSGTCFASTVKSSQYPYLAFDNNDNTHWSSTDGNGYNSYVGYQFDSPKKMYLFTFTATSATAARRPNNIKIQASNDNSTWTDLSDMITVSNALNPNVKTILNNIGDYSYYRLFVSTLQGSTGYAAEVKTIQFYGRVNGGVQSWLVSAGITNKAYTTLTEVFSDTETLRALLNNHDAVYYLTTVPGWATEFAANENAMKYIGANDYASNILLANEDWCKALSESSYYSTVLNVEVPIMTSNTTPSGECFGDATNGSYSYQAFDGNDSSRCYVANQIGKIIGYQFAFGCKVKNVFLKPYWSGDTYNVEGSNDSITWNNIGSIIGNVSGSTAVVNAITDYTYYRFNQATRISSNNLQEYLTAQFYGRSIGGVQSWLLAAGITNKNYTSISQVLADSDLLPVLIASHSGMDYLATCVAFANEICANETAMQLIGADNYASDVLLSNETWLNAICNSTYLESVLNVKIPTMTSDTTPSGVASASSNFGSSKAYFTMDNNDSSFWNGSQTTGWIKYDFGSQVKILSCYLNNISDSSLTWVTKGYTVQYSNDDNSFTDIVSGELQKGGSATNVFSSPITSRYFRINITSNWGHGSQVSLKKLQFYGRQDV